MYHKYLLLSVSALLKVLQISVGQGSLFCEAVLELGQNYARYRNDKSARVPVLEAHGVYGRIHFKFITGETLRLLQRWWRTVNLSGSTEDLTGNSLVSWPERTGLLNMQQFSSVVPNRLLISPKGRKHLQYFKTQRLLL